MEKLCLMCLCRGGGEGWKGFLRSPSTVRRIRSRSVRLAHKFSNPLFAATLAESADSFCCCCYFSPHHFTLLVPLCPPSRSIHSVFLSPRLSAMLARARLCWCGTSGRWVWGEARQNFPLDILSFLSRLCMGWRYPRLSM